jgi:hypothetical protein
VDVEVDQLNGMGADRGALCGGEVREGRHFHNRRWARRQGDRTV